MAVCQLPDWEPHLWLSDQREHDTAAEELWLHLSSQWQVHQTGANNKKTNGVLLFTSNVYVFRFLIALHFSSQQATSCGIVESIMNWVKFKAQAQLNKKCSAVKHTKIKGVPKLDDANDAGTVYQTHSFLFKYSLAISNDKWSVITMFSGRWEELHWLHADPHWGRLSQDTGCVWARSCRQGSLWRFPTEGKNAQCPGGHSQTGEAQQKCVSY